MSPTQKTTLWEPPNRKYHCASCVVATYARKVFSVSKRDRGRLADMLDCLERNDVITNKRTLDYLRQERNVHAHEVLDDRESLRRDALAIAKLYIQNIVYLWKERCKLEGKYFEAHGFAEVWNGG